MSTITEESQVSIIKVEEITSIMMNAGEILTKNTNLANAAVKKIQALLDTIEGGGMTAELDAELNSWQIKAKDAVKILNERRSLITQMSSKIVSAFTSLENDLNPQVKTSYYVKAQMCRNSYATKLAEEKRQKEQQILNKQKEAQERINVKAEAESQIISSYNTKLFEWKTYVNKLFNSITIESQFEVKKKIEDIKLLYPRDKFYELPVNITSIYLEKLQLAEIIHNTRVEVYDELATNFRENIEVIKQEVLDKIPSKINELKEMAKASKAQQEELKAQQAEREKQEAERLKNEAAEAKKQSEQKINEQKEADKINTLFDAQSQLAEIQPENKTKDGYEIIIKNIAGWGAIFMFFFERHSTVLSVDDFGKKTGNQMKAFAEKAALKDDNEKIDSIHLEYKPIIKAVVSK